MTEMQPGAGPGVGLGPIHRIPESARQEVLDAAAVLQVRRSETAARAARGDLTDLEVIGPGVAVVNDWMREASTHWRDLLSVRPWASTKGLRVSLPHNRTLLGRGLKMISIFGADGCDLDARLMLANEPVGTYLFSIAPVQMKIVDRQSVMLEGPTTEGQTRIMLVHSGPCLDAAWRYWQAALSCAVPAREGADALEELTPRQRQVVALMANGVTDEGIADTLGVSVRTVRTDVARVLDALGVRTRFAAGVRLRLWSGGPD